MAVDFNVFSKLKTKEDFDRERAAFDLRRQMAAAQMAQSDMAMNGLTVKDQLDLALKSRALDIEQQKNQITFGNDASPVTFEGGPVFPQPTGPLSARNNNPGNLKDPTTGNFRQFSSPEQGKQANIQDLQGKLSGKSPIMQERYGAGYTPTVSNVISTWAPPSDNNDTAAYIAKVSRDLGVDPDAPLRPDDAERLLASITNQEGGNAATSYFNNTSVNQTGDGGFAMMAQGDEQSPVASPLFARDAQGGYVTKTQGGNLPAGYALAKDPTTGKLTAARIPGVEIPPTKEQLAVKNRTEAKGKFDETLQNLQSLYDQLAQEGGAVTNTQPFWSNVPDYIANTGVGQMSASALGTKQQTIRDQIEAAKSLAAAQYIQAAGLTSGQTNSQSEQERFLRTLGSLTDSYEANQNTLANASRAYGNGTLQPHDINVAKGTVEDGYMYVGGDKADPKSWKKVK